MQADIHHREWEAAFDGELDEVCKRHPDQDLSSVRENLVGLAFSGGGIRSATFGLGILESLREFGLLKKVDYLSTVSGGGYIGAWLSANVNRHDGWLEPTQASRNGWKESIKHLRRYSNYLSPEVGFFSADTWSMLMIWIRNTLLIQANVILAIALALLVPRPLLIVFREWPRAGDWRWTTIALFILGVAGIAGNLWRINVREKVPLLTVEKWMTGLISAALLAGAAWGYAVWTDFSPFAGGEIKYSVTAPIAFALVLAGFFLQPVALKLLGIKLLDRAWGTDGPPKQINYTQAWVQAVVVLPMLATGLLVAAILWGESQPSAAGTTLAGLSGLSTYGEFFTTAWKYWPFPLSVLFASLWLLSVCSIHDRRDWKGWAAAVLAPAVAGTVLHALLCAIMLLLHGWAQDPSTGLWRAFVWAPSLVLYAFSLTIVMLIGMMGRQSTEGSREWWSRLGAWLGIYGFAWMVIAVTAVYGPGWFSRVLQAHPWKSLGVGGGWLGTIAGGLFAGRSDSTGGKSDKGSGQSLLEVVAAVAPFVFIAGLLILVATGLDQIVVINSMQHWFDVGSRSVDPSPFFNVSIALMGGCAVALVIMAARVDINEFSLNAFYRNRLVRCYLGATRFRAEQRNPQRFTGFDDDDDLRLDELAGGAAAGPFHIVNCALNLGGSSDLALHTRHSANFTLSPLQCGSSYLSRTQTGTSEELGYVATRDYGGRFGAPTLGQAISVSGAAASPNMGYHTSPVVAFLLTVFNVRLGWWFPNPRKSAVGMPSPRFNLPYLLAELFGGANDQSRFLMISDGGHFENLAVYELIRRRCRVIIASDGECDPKLAFEGLGTLIRVCEVDFGVKITLDVAALRPGADPRWSSNRCAVGRIEYGPRIPDGILIYFKASMTGHEDTSVLQYKATHPVFPHEPTGDQFYGEDQFESYRHLGREIAHKTLERVGDASAVAAMDVSTVAERLFGICSPTLDHIGRFTEHSTRLMQLWSKIGSDAEVKLLDEELFDAPWPSESARTTFRSAFYVCCEMLQLMENVYIDLRLDDTWHHADAAGWRALFTMWAKAPAIQTTWKMTASTYGLRFQYFCARNLDLPLPGAPKEEWT